MKKVLLFVCVILLYFPFSFLYAEQYLGFGLGDFRVKNDLKIIEHKNRIYHVENANLNYRNIKLIFGFTVWDNYNLDFQYNRMTDSEIIQTYSDCSSFNENENESNCHLVLDSTLNFFSFLLSQKKYLTHKDGFVYGIGLAHNLYKRELVVEYPNPDFDNHSFTTLESSSIGFHIKMGGFFYNNFEISLEYFTNIGEKDTTGTADAVGITFSYHYFFKQ